MIFCIRILLMSMLSEAQTRNLSMNNTQETTTGRPVSQSLIAGDANIFISTLQQLFYRLQKVYRILSPYLACLPVSSYLALSDI